MPEPRRKLRHSFVVYDKRTGELVSVHQVSAAEGTSLPPTRDLVQLVLRAASTHEQSPARLAVLEHEREITDPLRYAVNLRTGRLVAKRAARPAAGADGAPRRRRRSSVT